MLLSRLILFTVCAIMLLSSRNEIVKASSDIEENISAAIIPIGYDDDYQPSKAASEADISEENMSEPAIITDPNLMQESANEQATNATNIAENSLAEASNAEALEAEHAEVKTVNTIVVPQTNSINQKPIDTNTIASVMQIKPVPEAEISSGPFETIQPVARPDKNPYLVQASEFWQTANSFAGNSHLDSQAYVEQYYQLLFAAIQAQNIEGVKAVTQKIGPNYDIFIDNLSPLTYAINNNHTPDVIRTMLSLGYLPNTPDLNNKTPLHYAVALQKYDFAIELLLWGANPNLRAESEVTPFDLAMHNDDTIMLDILRRAIVN